MPAGPTSIVHHLGTVKRRRQRRHVRTLRRPRKTIAVRATLKALDFTLRGLQHLVSSLDLLARTLRSGRQQQVAFAGEGGVSLRIPPAPFTRRLRNSGDELNRRANFAGRPKHELLLRRIVFQLFEAGLVPRDHSVIDIGCWLGDNAIVWATFLDAHTARVHAIDPSAANLAFAASVATASGVDNIVWHEAVCSDVSGQRVIPTGDLDHATFRRALDGDGVSTLTTVTLDELIPDVDHARLGLLHVDVEGFELAVLKGAEQVIRASRPIILFEGHLRDADDIDRIRLFLGGHAYVTFLINEVLPGCHLDCRNFLAAPEALRSEVLAAVEGSGIGWPAIFPAVLGPELLPLPLRVVM